MRPSLSELTMDIIGLLQFSLGAQGLFKST
jgi:hypothetical protein